MIPAIPLLLLAGAALAQQEAQAQIVQGTLKIYGNDSYPVTYRRNQPITSPRARYPGFKPDKKVLKAGTVRREGAKVLPSDIVFERDVGVKLRDGITIYTDVFRPTGNGRVPAIVAWGPYGKEVGGQWLDDVPGRAGVPLSRNSELMKFEAPDPAYWVDRGYAVLNPDARGAYYSEGNITYWGRQLAEDGYDFVEWAAAQPWCNGKVAFSGNSYLAISQWFSGAANPPHLAALAPWEGFQDSYREASRRGGIANPGFGEDILQTFAGRNFVEDLNRMQINENNGLMSPYWEDKKARLEKINVPTYVVASYTSPIHCHGSFEGFRRISSKEKWLRVHNTGEWPDYYDPQYRAELNKFFDKYLKGIDNGWEKTPKVRISILDPGAKDTVNQVEEDWPVPGLTTKKMYLHADKTLSDQKPAAEASVAYNINAQTTKGDAEFLFKVPQKMELLNYAKVGLWVVARGSNDMELVVAVAKRDPANKPYAAAGSPFAIAAAGLLRVSHRALDQEKSTEFEPYHLHTREELLRPGEIVPIDVGLWPLSLRFRPGETLVLSVAANTIAPVGNGSMFGTAVVPIPADGGTFKPGERVELQRLGGPASSVPGMVRAQGVKSPLSRNKGTHVVHLGGKYDSHLLMPVRI